MSTAPPPGVPSASARCPVCGADVYREEGRSEVKTFSSYLLQDFPPEDVFFYSPRLSYLCGKGSRRHSGRVSYRGGLWLSRCGRGGKGAVHIERGRARVRGVGSGRRRRGCYHLQGLWRRTRLGPEHKHLFLESWTGHRFLFNLFTI